MNAQEFANPGTEYRGVTLWMLNDKLETEEIARQLKGFQDAGWGAVIGRTFNGLLTPYLGDEWMTIIRQIIEQSCDQDMRVWLQAGYMPSGMPELEASRAHKGLVRRTAGETGEDTDEALCEHEGFTYVVRLMPHVLDLLNPEAVTDYLDLAYKDPWHSRFAEHFGKTVEAVWVDEPHFRPPLLPWCDRLPAVFEQAWGYDLREHVPALFVKTGDFQKIRHHYWRTVLNLFLEGYFQPVGEWCEAHGVKFAGHLMGEDTINNQVGFTGACMPAYEYMQLPGIDHLTRSLRWPAGKKFILTPKQISSAASQLGKDQVLCEIFGVSAHSLSFSDRKRISDWMAVLGINYRCYHGSFYSMRGRRKRIYVPHLSYQQPWWPDNRLIADRCARLSYALRQGTTLADILVLHPVESVFGLYDPLTMARPHDRTSEADEVKTMDTALVGLCDALLSLQRGFEFGDELLLAKHGKVTADGLQMGAMAYKVVILPELLTLRRTTLDLLKTFADQGGVILATGPLPTRIDGQADPGIEALQGLVQTAESNAASLRKALDQALPADIALEGENCEGVWVHGRKIETGRLTFLTNTDSDKTVRGEMRLRATGRLEHWDLETGATSTAPQRMDGDVLVAPLDLPPLGSALFVLHTDETPVNLEPAPATVSGTLELAATWTRRCDQPNALTLDTCRLRQGQGEWNESRPVIYQQQLLHEQGYKGPITLAFPFQVETVPAKLCVVIEDAPLWQIEVNGKAVAYDGLPYYVDRAFLPVDIASAVQAGDNTIEISRDFQPVPKPKFSLAGLFEALDGVELESIYLIGDFTLQAEPSPAPAPPRCHRLAPDFTLTAVTDTTGGDLSADGYPFYAGRVFLQQEVELSKPAAGEQLVLALPGLHAALAKIRVNARDAGAILWAPFETEITSLVQAGTNVIEIELVGTLRNLLGPHHRAHGDPDDCWGTAFNYDPDAAELGHPEEHEGGWTDDYLVVPFGIPGRVRIKRLSP